MPTANIAISRGDIWDLSTSADTPYTCRRVATFPPPGGKLPQPSSIISMQRSKSESAFANQVALIALDDLKHELLTLVVKAAKHQQRDAKEVFDQNLSAIPNGHAEIGSAGQSSARSEGSDIETFVTSLPKFAVTRSKPRKKVTFADDHGRQLLTVRIMTEPSDVPPQISPEIIQRLVGDPQQHTPEATWELRFEQPCSKYLQFRRRLERQFVALENVIIKNDQCRLLGTVKVRNMHFEKSVVIRITDNNWASYLDKEAYYASSVPGDLYDTFSFDVEIPCDDYEHPRLEFCVLFRCNGQQFWDNNDGKNFALISQKVKQLWAPEQKLNAEYTTSHSGRWSTRKQSNDAYMIENQNWGNFASWHQLECEGPYW